MLERDEEIRARLREVVEQPGAVADEDALNAVLRRGKRRLLHRRLATMASVVVVVGGIGAGMVTLPALGTAPQKVVPATGGAGDRSTQEAPVRCHGKTALEGSPLWSADTQLIPKTNAVYEQVDLPGAVYEVLPQVEFEGPGRTASVRFSSAAGRGTVALFIARNLDTPTSSPVTSSRSSGAPLKVIGSHQAGDMYSVALHAANGLDYIVAVTTQVAYSPTGEACKTPLLRNDQLIDIAVRAVTS